MLYSISEGSEITQEQGMIEKESTEKSAPVETVPTKRKRSFVMSVLEARANFCSRCGEKLK